MPLANRSAAVSTSFGVTTNRGLLNKNKREVLTSVRPGPGEYETQNGYTAAFVAPNSAEVNRPSTRALQRSYSAKTFSKPQRRKVKKLIHKSREPHAFADSTTRFDWLEGTTIPGPGAYVKGHSLDLDRQQTLRSSYSAKSLSMFGQSARVSAFGNVPKGGISPGPGDYNNFRSSFLAGPPFFGAGEEYPPSRAQTAPFASDVPRFSDKYRFDGVATPAPCDIAPKLEWQHEQTRAPATYSHQSVFKQQTKGPTLASGEAGTQERGRTASSTRSTAKLLHLGPGSHETINHSMEYSVKNTVAPAAGSMFASTAMRFGGRGSYGPQLGKREKWMAKLKHKENVEAIKKGEPMFAKKGKQ